MVHTFLYLLLAWGRGGGGRRQREHPTPEWTSPQLPLHGRIGLQIMDLSRCWTRKPFPEGSWLSALCLGSLASSVFCDIFCFLCFFFFNYPFRLRVSITPFLSFFFSLMIRKYLSDRSFIKILLSESIQEGAGLVQHSGFPCLRGVKLFLALPGHKSGALVCNLW